MTIKYPQNLGGGKVPGTWRRVLSDGKPIAKFSCPLCGFTAGLGDGSHEIDIDGIVSPSVVCDSVGCTFHEFVQLQGWKHYDNT